MSLIRNPRPLDTEELRRYARHLTLPEVGVEGQMKLRAASVLCIGAGGLGSPIALYLAAAGIGRLGLVDFDAVDLSNLQRQILHGTPDVGRPKLESARESLSALNPGVEVVPYAQRLTSANALEIIQPYDIVVDGSDNLPTRYLVNDACVFLRKPNVYGAVFRFEGQASVFAPHLDAPCYRCLYPEPPPSGPAPSCAEAGVLGVVPGIIGTIQATEILKLTLGTGSPLLGRLLLYNALEMQFREIRLRRDPGCPICGHQPTITRLLEYEAACSASSTPAAAAVDPDEVDVHELKRALDAPEDGLTVLDVREPHEHALARIPGAILCPLSSLPQRVSDLDPNRLYYIHCKAGVRSMQALQFLRQRGFRHVKSVRGGILAWAEQIDPTMPSP